MRKRRLFVIFGCVAVLVAAVALLWCLFRPKPLYRVTFLPTMGGVEVRPHAINDSGRVAATVRMPDGTERVVLWDKSGRTEDLDFLPKGHSMWRLAINNAGEVAGTVSDANFAASSFFWDTDGRRHTLDAPAGEQVRIAAINDRGQVVGHLHAAKGPRNAFLWDKTAGMRDLSTFRGSESFACDINDWGQIVGFFSRSAGDWRAFICDPNLGMQELGPTHYDEGSCCINNRGFVVGQFGSAQPGLCVSTWTARTGLQQLPLKGGDFLRISGLNEANRCFVNVHYRGIRVLRQQLGERSESHLWESGRHVRRLDERICLLGGDRLDRGDIEAIGGWDINKDGTILGVLIEKGQPCPHAVILEPIE